MKNLKKVKFLVLSFILTIAFCSFNSNVSAKTMSPDEIPGSTYVIGSHMFTRDVNETTGYEGRLTTNLIMLAAQTIGSSDLDNMIIYYKTATGTWINGLTGSPIEVPETFEINYTNLQLEEDNNTVSKPKVPIVIYEPISANEETDLITYQLDIYIDDVDDTTNKVDGVEISIINSPQSTLSKRIDLPYGENFTSTATVLNNYEGTSLIIGKTYHNDYVTFETQYKGYNYINARAYVKDDNGEKIYSDTVVITINSDDLLPQLKIINDYSNPDYIAIDNDYYIYRLGIEIPDAYVYKANSNKFAYRTNCSNEIFELDEKFTVAVAKDTVKSCYAQMGYIDKNGDFQYFMPTNVIYYTIDTRTLTAPILYYNTNNNSPGPSSTIDAILDGEYIRLNNKFYEEQEEDTLDYQIDGSEIYRVYYKNSEPVYELITEMGFAHVFPPSGYSYYVARVYAFNALGEKVYSDFSDYTPVVRTPIISVSEVLDGKVTVSIDNINDYRKDSGITFTLYGLVDSTNEEVELGNIIYQGDQELVFEIEVTENMQVYASASINDWIHSTSDQAIRAYSYKSNGVDIIA